MAETKKCLDCGEKQSLHNFSRYSKTKDGFSDTCKSCTLPVVIKKKKKNVASYEQELYSRMAGAKFNHINNVNSFIVILEKIRGLGPGGAAELILKIGSLYNQKLGSPKEHYAKGYVPNYKDLLDEDMYAANYDIMTLANRMKINDKILTDGVLSDTVPAVIVNYYKKKGY